MRARVWLLLLVVLAACWRPAAADTPAPGDFSLIYEYDSGQRIPHPYRFRVTLGRQTGTFTRWDADGKEVRETPFALTPEDVDGLYRVAVQTNYFGLMGGVPAAMLDSPSQWVTLTADRRSLTVWAQASGNRSPAALEAIASRVRALLQQRVYDWQSTPGVAAPPLTLPFTPMRVDALKGEVGFIHLGDPPEAVEAVWGRGSGAVSARRSRSTFIDYYSPGEPTNSLLTVVYAGGRAGEIRVNLVSPSGRVLRGALQVMRGGRGTLSCDAGTSVAQVKEAMGPPSVDSVDKDPKHTGFLEYGRLAFYFFENRIRYVRLAGTMENQAASLPGDMPHDFEVTWWRRSSRQELENGWLYGISYHMTMDGGYRTRVSRQGQVEVTEFPVDATELRGFYRLLRHGTFYSLPSSYPPTLPDTPVTVMEGDEGVRVWSRLGVYRVDVLGIRGHDLEPPSVKQIMTVAQRLASRVRKDRR